MHQSRFSETTLSATIAAAIQDSPDVAKWLLGAMARTLGWNSEGHNIHAVHHSFTDASLDRRETDILAVFTNAAPSISWILVEVKINAPFGYRQPEDYGSRKSSAVAIKKCHACGTVLIAPRRYLDSHPRDKRVFDLAVTLEELSEIAAPLIGTSVQLLRNHVRMALELSAIGYVPLVSAIREQQIAWYDSFVQSYGPHLTLKPTNAGKQVRDRMFSVPLQTRGYITHRIFAGRVTMVFMSRRHLFAEVKNEISLLGRSRVNVAAQGTSLFFDLCGVSVPPLDEHRSFAEQEQLVKAGLDAVDLLHQWAIENTDLLRRVVNGRL